MSPENNHKGSKKAFSNYRGIFRVTVLRSIIDKLIYNDEYDTIDKHLTDSNVGARRNRNIRDNIFVISAISHNIRKRNLRDTDIQIYDAEKCFDKLWAKECFNDVFENGFRNDKLALLYNVNKDAKVAIKTIGGVTNRISIRDTIMQGTVWGSLLCTSTIDKLGKQSYEKPEHLYKYKGVPIPPLGMVDDIICVTNVEQTQQMNKLINTFIESKRLKLSQSKCYQIHMGKGHENCPKLKVHDAVMKEVKSEKYLGDVIDTSGSIQATIDSRKSKGQGIVSEILSIINEIPLGKHKIDVAMKLREVMLLNGILYNSEAWHGLTKKQVSSLEAIDESLLRGILQAHAKTPSEFLYLETGATPIKWVISQRRLNYLKHITSREDTELVKKVYLAQKEAPTHGDFVKLVEQDMVELNMSYQQLEVTDKVTLKAYLKKNATHAAFTFLKSQLEKHMKVKDIQYETFVIQPYLRSANLHSEEMKTLTAVRSMCVRNVKANFRKMFKGKMYCPLLCNSDNPAKDTQEHLLICPKLNTNKNNELGGIGPLSISQAFANIVNQEIIAKAIYKLIRKRTILLDTLEVTNTPHPRTSSRGGNP